MEIRKDMECAEASRGKGGNVDECVSVNGLHVRASGDRPVVWGGTDESGDGGERSAPLIIDNMFG